MTWIDLSADVGETFLEDAREIDRALIPLLSACHVSCGVHAGDEDSILHAIDVALAHEVLIGAHPSYPDREHGGRKSMWMPVDVLCELLGEQIEDLSDLAGSLGASLSHVKPHGALYNDLAHDEELARGFAEFVSREYSELAVYAMSGSVLVKACKELEVPVIEEAFAERRYASATRLVSREEAGAIISDRAELGRQIDELLSGRIRDRYDQMHVLKVDSICIHSDSPGAVELALLVRQRAQERGIRIAQAG